MTEPTRSPRFMQNMPPDLIRRIDDYAKRYSLSRNAAVNYLCTFALETLNDGHGPRAVNERRSI